MLRGEGIAGMVLSMQLVKVPHSNKWVSCTTLLPLGTSMLVFVVYMGRWWEHIADPP